MSVTLPDVRVGKALRYKSVSVFPLFTEDHDDVEYTLADEAIAEKSLTIEEVSKGGSVPELLVENQGDTRVLLIEGEELVGAKQNRILNTSILIAAKSKAKIPVSCVEQGRWSYKSKQFGSSGHHSSSKLRHALKKSVSQSAKAGQGHRSNQGEVWNQVESMLCSVGSESSTVAMSDAYEDHQVEVDQYKKKLKYVKGATGVAVAVGNKVLGFDLFDKSETCNKVWERILSGCVMDALSHDEKGSVTGKDVSALIAESSDAHWEQVAAAGEGDEYRVEFDNEHGSALSLAGTLVHESVVAG